MKKFIQNTLLVLGLLVGLSAFLLPTNANAVDVFEGCSSNSSSVVCQGTGNDLSNIIGTISDILMFILGGVAVIMIIYAGILYATSAGDTTKVTTAKNTILYAVVGIIVALLAYAIVSFVIGRFT